MNDAKKNCDLCSLVIEVAEFNLNTKQGDKHFCCEGCKGIYQLLNEDELLDDERAEDK